MASQFKNRLVGVTILVALVVIFLPSVIDGKKTSYQQNLVSTPIKPKLKAHSKQFEAIPKIKDDKIIVENLVKKSSTEKEEAPEEWKVEEIAEILDIESPNTNNVTTKKTAINKTAESKPQEIIPKKTTVKVEFKDPAWTIQLGAFQNKANINSLLKKLSKEGFQVHTIPKEVMDGQLTRVFVGPGVSKKALEDKLPRLKRLTKLNGKLVPFNPIQP